MINKTPNSIQPIYPGINDFWKDVQIVVKELNYIRQRQSDFSLILRAAKKRLNQIIRFASINIPFYKKSFSLNKYSIPKILEICDLHLLPFLTKEIIRDNSESLYSATISKIPLFKRRTSGTTGIPVTIAFDSFSVTYDWIVIARRLEQLGLLHSVDKSDRNNFVIISDTATDASWSGNLPFFNYPVITKFIFYEAQSREEKLHCIEQITNLRPIVIFGMPTALLYFANYLKEEYKRYFPSPQIVITSGEQLYRKARLILQDTLDTRVYNQYSITEVGNVACECIYQRGLHFEMDHVLVETVKGNSSSHQGKIGEIVVTSLTNYAMPIIRYRTGDLGKISYKTCRCGVSYPRITDIQGRIVYFFQKEDGSLYNPHPLRKVLNTLDFSQYQVIQLSHKDIELRFMSNHPEPRIDKAIQIIREFCGNVKVNAVEVESFPSSIKRSNFVSNIPNPYL